MIRPFIRKINAGAVAVSSTKLITVNNIKLSESQYRNFLPIMSVSVNNASLADIEILINETDEASFPVSAGASRTISGFPVMDLSVKNLSAVNAIAAGQVILTLLNDLEQCARWNAYEKTR